MHKPMGEAPVPFHRFMAIGSGRTGRILARPLFVALSFPAPCTCSQSRDVPRERLGNEVRMRKPAGYDCERTPEMIIHVHVQYM